MEREELERQERRRRAQKKQEQKRRQKQQRAVTAVILLLIVVLAMTLALVSCKGGREDKNTEAREPVIATETPADTRTGEGTDTGEDTPSGGRDGSVATLTEAQKYQGDLILVNSSYPYHFDENAADIHLVEVGAYENGIIPVASEGLQLSERIMGPLLQMIQACNRALGVSDTGVTSAHRSLEYQQQTFREYADSYGQEYAKAYVADPGYSEHHTGLSLDMGIYYVDGSPGHFSSSSNAVWMDENCQDYGFIRRYQEDKVDITGISNEAWHFRYVGIPHATYMNRENLCLEEYIQYLREQTGQDNPLRVSCKAGEYEIYSTKESNIPGMGEHDTISGDNIDGYIVTHQIANQ